MGASPVRRCVAVAAHGKRCQQTPFRGSPYCWHHTQSRKVWAPSRVRPLPGRQASPAPEPAQPPVAAAPPPAPAPVPVARVEPVTATAAELGLAVAQLCQHLDPKELAALLHFVEHGEAGALCLEKSGGELAAARVDRPQPARRARRAKA